MEFKLNDIYLDFNLYNDRVFLYLYELKEKKQYKEEFKHILNYLSDIIKKKGGKLTDKIISLKLLRDMNKFDNNWFEDLFISSDICEYLNNNIIDKTQNNRKISMNYHYLNKLLLCEMNFKINDKLSKEEKEALVNSIKKENFSFGFDHILNINEINFSVEKPSNFKNEYFKIKNKIKEIFENNKFINKNSILFLHNLRIKQNNYFIKYLEFIVKKSDNLEKQEEFKNEINFYLEFNKEFNYFLDWVIDPKIVKENIKKIFIKIFENNNIDIPKIFDDLVTIFDNKKNDKRFKSQNFNLSEINWEEDINSFKDKDDADLVDDLKTPINNIKSRFRKKVKTLIAFQTFGNKMTVNKLDNLKKTKISKDELISKLDNDKKLIEYEIEKYNNLNENFKKENENKIEINNLYEELLKENSDIKKEIVKNEAKIVKLNKINNEKNVEPIDDSKNIFHKKITEHYLLVLEHQEIYNKAINKFNNEQNSKVSWLKIKYQNNSLEFNKIKQENESLKSQISKVNNIISNNNKISNIIGNFETLFNIILKKYNQINDFISYNYEIYHKNIVKIKKYQNDYDFQSKSLNENYNKIIEKENYNRNLEQELIDIDTKVKDFKDKNYKIGNIYSHKYYKEMEYNKLLLYEKNLVKKNNYLKELLNSTIKEKQRKNYYYNSMSNSIFVKKNQMKFIEDNNIKIFYTFNNEFNKNFLSIKIKIINKSTDFLSVISLLVRNNNYNIFIFKNNNKSKDLMKYESSSYTINIYPKNNIINDLNGHLVYNLNNKKICLKIDLSLNLMNFLKLMKINPTNFIDDVKQYQKFLEDKFYWDNIVNIIERINDLQNVYYFKNQSNNAHFCLKLNFKNFIFYVEFWQLNRLIEIKLYFLNHSWANEILKAFKNYILNIK